jgi:acyl-[acyl-carrier-protein]-phospholipid O-acyltransferase/long-chain-fatty-acid--[acyl-carrier-protein] ligase
MFRRSRSSFQNKITDGFSPQKHSLGFLNISQFLGVVNDNLFKFVLIFMLIDFQGARQTNTIVSLAGAIFVIPFLLFSSSAGVLADRYSKQRILRYIKAVEIVIMLLALVAFGFHSAWAGYTLLFCLAAQSAFFGPAKYGIIPELVPKEAISKSNGLITSFTYLGIIIGTFFASAVTEMTNRSYMLVIAFALLLAIIGYLASFGVKYTQPQGSKKKFNPYIITTIFRTLYSVRHERHLLMSTIGAAYFLFIGAFTQLNIIPFAMQALGLNEISGGYLFLTTAIGIAIGSLLAGKASKKRVELAISCLSGVFITLFLFCLAIFSNHLSLTIFFLVVLGVCGGTFIVPFDTFIQVFSPHTKRGQVIAAANFLSFTGVLVASGAIYLFGNILHLSASSGFFVIALLTLAFTLLLITRISDFVFHFLSATFYLKPRLAQQPNLSVIESHPDLPLIIEKGGFKEIFLLLGLVPHLHVFVTRRNGRHFPWFENLFYSLHLIEPEKTLSSLIENKKNLIKPDEHLCILGERPKSHEEISFTETVKSFFGLGYTEAIVVNFSKNPQGKTLVSFTKKSL